MKQVIAILLVFLQTSLLSQEGRIADSIHVIRQFEIYGSRDPERNPALTNLKINCAENGNSAFSLAELMSRNSPAFIKQYSPGGLSSPSLRGTGAAHTALIWNGINLQSNMNGQQDLSLIPAMLFDAFRIQEGSSNSSWGSGAIGGAVFLESATIKNNHFRFGSNIGSFGLSQQFADLSFQVKSVSFRSRVFRTYSLNNFKFEDISLPSKPLIHQHNSEINMLGGMQDIGIKCGKHSKIDISFWYQNSLRNLPPILTVPISVARQTDKNIRSNVRYQYSGNKSEIRLNLAFLHDLIHYEDSLLWQDSHNKSYSYIAGLIYAYRLNAKHKLEAGHLFTYSEARADGYGSNLKHQTRPAFFANLYSHLIKNKLTSLVSIRQEFLNGKSIQPQASLALAYLISKSIKIRSQVASTYRIPTLNDLYWIPGGNPGLQPEQGFSAESGLDFYKSFKQDKISFSINPGIFYNKIRNWIQWTPTATYWTPMNLQNVGSAGAEIRLESNFQINTHQSLELIFHAQHVDSEILKNNQLPELESRKLIYVPQQTASGTLVYAFEDCRLSFNLNYVSQRYVTTDNSEYLPSYYLINMNITKRIKTDHLIAQLFLGINNLLNQQYQVVLRRPMPMRNWLTGIQFEI